MNTRAFRESTVISRLAFEFVESSRNVNLMEFCWFHNFSNCPIVPYPRLELNKRQHEELKDVVELHRLELLASLEPLTSFQSAVIGCHRLSSIDPSIHWNMLEPVGFLSIFVPDHFRSW